MNLIDETRRRQSSAPVPAELVQFSRAVSKLSERATRAKPALCSRSNDPPARMYRSMRLGLFAACCYSDCCSYSSVLWLLLWSSDPFS